MTTIRVTYSELRPAIRINEPTFAFVTIIIPCGKVNDFPADCNEVKVKDLVWNGENYNRDYYKIKLILENGKVWEPIVSKIQFQQLYTLFHPNTHE